MNPVYVLDIVEKHRGKLGGLLSMLQDIQLAVGYLPKEALMVVADATGRSLTDLYGFATFYRDFRFEPDATNLIENSPQESGNYIYVRCPRCNHSLMDPECLIEHLPSVRITVSFGMEHGWLRIPSSEKIDSFACEHELPLKGVVNFFCPHCHTEIVTAENCALCSAPMIPQIAKQGFVKRCSRSDCISRSKKQAAGMCS